MDIHKQNETATTDKSCKLCCLFVCVGCVVGVCVGVVCGVCGGGVWGVCVWGGCGCVCVRVKPGV